ncbi:MAG: [FeFe] hydrogenase H-cluster maturation GTPase HydF [Candidatus Cloacimonadaceae bacterium]|nr:[FeFe] hydrogenase H-cluster maturation GTPase HydF [Candidatus Cloacimonadaceae bacterium]
MHTAPRGERLIITLLGNRNAGKSSLINAITGQEIAIVSEIPGTTTDPVDKRYELLPLGSVTFYDTAGLDDSGELGEKRVKATIKILYRTDIALFINDGSPFSASEYETLARIREMNIPLLMVFNKLDLNPPAEQNIAYCKAQNIRWISVSAEKGEYITAAKNLIIELAPQHTKQEKTIIGDLVSPKDRVILVTPIDSAAPKGRLILPQVQVLRDLLDSGAIVLVVREFELIHALQALNTDPDLVITDSQVIKEVVRDLPPGVKLTTFSILFARYKGDLNILAEGVRQIDKLLDGDRILIAEACSHHVQADDIGRVKLPRWLKEYTGKSLIHEVYSGHDFPENLEEYALVIHCGGCMLNFMEQNRRIVEARRRGVPITNYGLAISKLQGVFERAVEPFGI